MALLGLGEAYYSGGVDSIQFGTDLALGKQQMLDLFRASWTSAVKDDIRGFDLADSMNGGGGDDRLSGNAGTDTLAGGAGDDVLLGGGDDDTYVYNLGDGSDVISEFTNGGANDRLVFGAGISVVGLTFSQDPYSSANGWITFADGARVALLGLGEAYYSGGVDSIQFGTDPALGKQQMLDLFRAFWTSAIKDDIRGFDLADIMNGGAGDDRLFGNDGTDTLSGGTGDDVLLGGIKDDTYVYNLGDGSDVIVESNYGGTNDKIVFGTGILASQLTFSFDPFDIDTLRIKFINGDVLTILDAFGTNGAGVDRFEFADGTIWDRTIFAAQVGRTSALLNVINGDGAANLINGTAASDKIVADAGNDLIAGGAGDDYADGGFGNDAYIFNLGDGRDVFHGGFNTDALRFGANILPTDILVRLDEIDHSFLVLKIAGTNDEIRVRDVELIEFANGTIWPESQLYEIYATQNSTSGDDYIHTFDGNDTVNSEAGNDRIYSEDGSDTIAGGAGDDFANGGFGNDAYVFNRGDGRDVFNGYYDTDTLRFGANILPSEILVRLDEADHSYLVLKIAGTNDEVRVTDVERIEFTNGTVWTEAQLYEVYATQNSTSGNDYIHTFDGNDTVNSGAGNDRIYSEDGSDTIAGGAGDDFANGGFGNDAYVFNRGDGRDVFNGYYDTDTLRFGANILPSEILVRLDEADHAYLVLKIAGTNDEVRVTDVERIEFANGTIWTETQLYEIYATQNSTSGDDYVHTFDGNDTVNSGAGNDRIYSEDGSDTITGGAGDDFANGGFGNDVYVFNRGDGRDVFSGSYDTDTLRFGAGIAIDDVEMLSTAANWTTLRLRDTGETVEVSDVEYVEYSDGTRVTLSQLINSGQQSVNGSGPISGDSLDNLLVGSSAADQIRGYGGNDVLAGSTGSDTYLFDAGDGHDTIIEGIDIASTDTLKLGAGILTSDLIIEASSANSNDIIVRIRGTDDIIILKNQLGSTGFGIERILFDNGAIWTRANIIATEISSQSTAGNDSIFGNSLDNVITGGVGDDVIDGGGGSDQYIYGTGHGNDRIIDRSSTDQTDTLTLNFAYTAAPMSWSRSSDGQSLLIGVGSSAITVDQQFGQFGYGIDVVTFTSGEAFSRAAIQNFVLQGSLTAGDDIVFGFESNDVINGLAGNDVIDGALGSDTYQFASIGGHDIVRDRGAASDVDALVFGAGIFASSVLISRELSGAYRLTDTSGTWSVTLEGGFGGIEQVRFSDNSIWTQAELRQKYYDGLALFNDGTITGDETNELITASNYAETINGSGGNDVVNAAGGNDIIFGDAGNDILNGGDGDDVFEGGLGLDSYDGGAGFDTAHFGYSIADWVVDLSLGTAHTLANATVDESLISIEGVVTGSGNDTLRGNIARNILTSGSGTDLLLGGEGDDELDGGSGNDTLNGGLGNDLLIGGAGADALEGGDGSDTVDYSTSAAGVLVSLLSGTASGGDAQGDTLLSIEHVTGSLFSDNLAGNSAGNTLVGLGGNDVLDGGDGDDWIEGGAGADQIIGGLGLDYASYSTSGSGVTVSLLTGAGMGGDAQGDTLSGIERLYGSAFVDTFIGSAQDNYLYGLGGNDILDGGTGVDTMIGGLGDDTYYVDAAGDVVTELAGEGTDTINSSVTLTNRVNVERLILTGTVAINATGLDTQADILTGNSVDNTLAALGGNDVLDGGAGNDWIDGGAGADQIIGGLGLDYASYSTSGSGVSVSLLTGAGTGGDAQGDTLLGIERTLWLNVCGHVNRRCAGQLHLWPWRQ